MPDRIIVTGGAGYIGSHACKALAAAGYLPVSYDNLSTGNRWAVKWGPLEVGDVLDPGRLAQVFEAHRPLGVMHFAALALVGESMRTPDIYYRTNVTGTLNLLDVCRLREVTAFVLSSSCAVYGTPGRLPITEDAPKAPINPYGASKLMAERVLTDYDKAWGLRHMALRYFNAAGADPEGDIGECRVVETHLLPLMLDAVAGQRPALMIMGDDYPTPDGTAIRDYIHVSDVASAHVRALNYLLTNEASRILNLGTGRGYSVREVIEAAAEVAGNPIPYTIASRRPGDPDALVADASAAHLLFGEDLTRRSSLLYITRTAWQWQNSDTYADAVAARCSTAQPSVNQS